MGPDGAGEDGEADAGASDGGADGSGGDGDGSEDGPPPTLRPSDANRETTKPPTTNAITATVAMATSVSRSMVGDRRHGAQMDRRD